jgi:hypothetical protein
MRRLHVVVGAKRKPLDPTSISEERMSRRPAGFGDGKSGDESAYATSSSSPRSTLMRQGGEILL